MCLLGQGRWGQVVANRLRSSSRAGRVDVFDTDPRRSTVLAANWREAVVQARPQVVVVCTPSRTHAEIAAFTTQRGLATLVEKPLCTDSEELLRLSQIAGGKRLMAGHLLRFHPGYQMLEHLVTKQTYGRLQGVEIHRTSLARDREGESAWVTMAPHDLSTLFALGLGSLNRLNIQGDLSRIVARLEFDTVEAVLRYDTQASARRRELCARATSATFRLDEDSPTQLAVTSPTERSLIPIPTGNALQLELDHFLRCAQSGDPFRTGIEEAAPVVHALELGMRALKRQTVRKWSSAQQMQCHEGAE